MARAVIGAVVIAVLLLLGAILISTETPQSMLAALLTIAAGILFGGVIWAIFISAWRTKGWSLRHPGREDDDRS